MCLLCGCKSERSQQIADLFYAAGFGASDAIVYFISICNLQQSINLSDHSSLKFKNTADYFTSLIALGFGLCILKASFSSLLEHNRKFNDLQKSGDSEFRVLNRKRQFLKASGYLTATMRAIVGFAAVVFALSEWTTELAVIIIAYFISFFLMLGQFHSSAALFCNQRRSEIIVDTVNAAPAKPSHNHFKKSAVFDFCYTIGAAPLYFDNFLKLLVHLRIPHAKGSFDFKTVPAGLVSGSAIFFVVFLFISTLVRYQGLIQGFFISGTHKTFFKRQSDMSIPNKAIHLTATVGKMISYGSLFNILVWPIIKNIPAPRNLNWLLVVFAHVITFGLTLGRFASALGLYFQKHRGREGEHRALLNDAEAVAVSPPAL